MLELAAAEEVTVTLGVTLAALVALDLTSGVADEVVGLALATEEDGDVRVMAADKY